MRTETFFVSTGTDLVFGRSTVDRFVSSTVRRRAIDAWKTAGLQPIGLHEGRNSAAKAGNAAGLDDLARGGARRMICAALEAEVDQYVSSFAEENTPARPAESRRDVLLLLRSLRADFQAGSRVVPERATRDTRAHPLVPESDRGESSENVVDGTGSFSAHSKAPPRGISPRGFEPGQVTKTPIPL